MRAPPFFVLVACSLGSLHGCSSRSETPYGACQASAACSEETGRCVGFRNRITMQNAMVCTTSCTTSADCPDRGVCIPTETPTLGSLCMQRCTTPAECRFNRSNCVVVRDNESACVP